MPQMLSVNVSTVLNDLYVYNSILSSNHSGVKDVDYVYYVMHSNFISYFFIIIYRMSIVQMILLYLSPDTLP